MFQKLLELWTLNYITVDTLRKWVDLHNLNPDAGITEEEFERIIHSKDNQ